MNNDINDLIKQHVDRHVSEVDPNEIWEGILKKEKPKKRFLFFLPIGLLALVGLSLLLWNPTNTELPVSKLQKTNESYLTDAGSNLATTQAIAEAIKDKKLQSSTIHSEKDINKNSADKNPSSKRQQTQKNNIAKVKKEKIDPSSQSASNNKSVLFKTHNQKLSAESSSRASSLSSLVSTIIRPSAQNNTVEKISILSLTSQYVVGTKEGSHIASLSFTQSILPLVDKSKSRIKANIIAGIVKSNYSSDFREAYTLGLMYEQRLARNFSVSAGISLDRLYEKFQWNGHYVTDHNGQNIGLASEDEQGNAAVNFGSADYDAEYYEIVERDIINYNHYDFIDLPIVVGYNFSIAGIRTAITAGTYINLNTSSFGLKLDSKMVPAQLGANSLKAGPKYILGIELNYPLNNRVGLTGILNYSKRDFSTNSTKNSANIYQAGLGFSVELR